MADFPSQFDIGEPIFFEIQGAQVKGFVRTVTFTKGKVRYSLGLFESADNESAGYSTIHNVDSVWVKPRQGDKVDLDFDNYS